MVNVAEIFSVPLKTLEDIDKLTKGIELGKYEVVWSRMTSEKSKAVMDAIFAMWYAFVAANPSGTCASSLVNSSSLRNMAKDTSNLIDTMHIDESPIFISVSIQEKPSSYVGAVGGSKPKPRSGFTIETVSIHPIVDTPIIEKTNDGFQMVGKKKGKSKSTNGGQFGGHLFKQDVRYELKATAGVPKKGATKNNLPFKAIVPPTKECNISMSNSYAALDYESEEEVENVYDESANLLNSTKHVKFHLLSRLLLVSFLDAFFCSSYNCLVVTRGVSVYGMS
ncbi:hypothetical protein Tco_0736679 [Tanacetum coccineum]